MLRIYIIGLSILVFAIIINVLVSKFGLSTWYDFGQELSNSGANAIKETGVVNLIWLFLLYPICLGLAVIIGEKIYGLF
tara:strand:- start:207 stop:443 length:237 start_codon:yes stop_codon:yes gene_type:complete